MSNQPEWRAEKVEHEGVTFEFQAYRNEGQSTKAILSYDQSLARVRTAEFDEHPQPNDLFQFLIYCIENKLRGSMDADDLAVTADGIEDITTTILKGNVFADMQSDRGEWLNHAWEVRKRGLRQLLTSYVGVHNLVFVDETYVPKDNFYFAKHFEFDVTGIPLQTWVPLHRFDEEIQVHLYSRRFADLPQEMRENEDPKKNAALYLPPEGVIWPVGRRCHGRFAIGTHKTLRASRGVYIH